MRARHVLWVLGLILRPFSALLLVPAAVDFAHGAHGPAAMFVGAAAASFGAGWLLARRRGDTRHVGRIEAMAVVASAWLVVALVGAVPYLHQGFSFVDAYFESMSGFTTTGSTIFQSEDFTRLSKGLLLWRCFSQWLGGLGIIVLFVAVLPALAVAGRQMFFAEAPGPEEEALTPRIRHTAVALWRLYLGLTVLEAILLHTVGDMSVFDGVCHAFTTMAAGGFSPNGRSLEGYGAAAQWIVIPFMFCAGASFTLQYRGLRRPRLFGRDPEFLTYAMIVVFGGLVLGLLLAGGPGHDFEGSLRHGFFQTLSILTTTGYASEDFNLWSQGALMVLGLLFFVGGCAGSAGGGPKVVRLVVLAKFVAREVLFARHPRAVRSVRLGKRTLQNDTIRQVVGFLAAYFAIFGLAAIAVGVIEDDLRTGLMGSIATLGNIGPGYGALGPMATFGDLKTATKCIFIATMWIGRLEVMTVLVLLHPEALRGLFGRTRRS